MGQPQPDILTDALESIITANLPEGWSVRRGSLMWIYHANMQDPVPSVGWFHLDNLLFQAYVNLEGWHDAYERGFYGLDLGNPSNTEEVIHRFIKNVIKLMHNAEMKRNKRQIDGPG